MSLLAGFDLVTEISNPTILKLIKKNMQIGGVPGTNGSFSPLQFSSLQVHCIGNSDRSKQALGLFGNLLASTQNNGNHVNKTSTAIASGRDLAISISPGTFHSLAFCPAVAAALGVSPNGLPPSCGGSGGVSVSGVTLTSIADSFGNGQINISGSAEDAQEALALGGQNDPCEYRRTRLGKTESRNRAQPRPRETEGQAGGVRDDREDLVRGRATSRREACS
ncbi:MAG: hypothetical protein HYY65_13855 [Candidatus Tectomicrobia bacterium]|uniref:Uncharacterized protein n=1 Tax=Tectimicrobiota bacterium TaxID=2528274 RepID=A0A932GSG4_UNCTE|nr:hypothetical protein [Candidatus Tectomicrobia bacterium]